MDTVAENKHRWLTRLLRYVTYVLLFGLAAVGGSCIRIAKITIKEPGRSRTTFRLCLPGKDPDVFGITDRDFMCHLYDYYGFRHLGGFGKSTR